MGVKKSKNAPGFNFQDDDLVGPLEVRFVPIQKRPGNRSWLVSVVDVGDEETCISIEGADAFPILGPALDEFAEKLDQERPGARLDIRGTCSEDSDGDALKMIVAES